MTAQPSRGPPYDWENEDFGGCVQAQGVLVASPWRRAVAAVVLGCAACLVGAIAAAADGSYGPVARAETLWSIAGKMAGAGNGSTAQVAWAIYEANPQAFAGAPGRILPGSMLRIPEPAVIKATPHLQAYIQLNARPAPVTVPPRPASTVPASADLELPPPPGERELAVGAAVLVAASAPVAIGGFDGSADQEALAAKARAQAPAEERYQVLAALEDRYAGDLDFDYPLGTLALDTGRYSEAVFVLQRAVSTRPSFSGARMELARAYYALGDNESARREFTALQQENPPPAARRTIEQYLGAIDQRAVGYEPQRGAYAELAAGFDSNANGAPDIQNFIGFTLDSRNQATSSPYYGVGVGGSLSHPFAPSWRALGHGLASYRGNPDASFVDSQVVRLGGGLEWHPNRWTLALVPSGTYAMLDGQENHQVVAADGSATYGFEEGQIGLSLRYAQQRYTDELAVQDIDTFLYGVSTQTRLRFSPRLQLGAAVTVGTDEAVEPSSPFGRDLIGVRASAVLDLGRGSVVFVSLTDLDSDFDGAFFGEPRSDEQLNGVLGYEFSGWRASGWTARVQASYVDNASTVDLYDYDRLDAGLSLRKEFK
jgi:tetratricopeptide (TPR) repeat protein